MIGLATQQVQKDLDALELKPGLREQLEASLSTYADLKFDLDALEHLAGIERLTLGKLLEEAGIDKAKVDQFNLCWVRGGTTSSLDTKKLIAQGVTMAQIEAATITKPKKDYFQIRQSKESSE